MGYDNDVGYLVLRGGRSHVVRLDVVSAPCTSPVTSPELPVTLPDGPVPNTTIFRRGRVEVGFFNFLLQFFGDLLNASGMFDRDGGIVSEVNPSRRPEDGGTSGAVFDLFNLESELASKFDRPRMVAAWAWWSR